MRVYAEQSQVGNHAGVQLEESLEQTSIKF